MNNTESRTTFIFNLTWADQLAELDDATRLRFMDAIIAYAKDGTMPKMSALEKALFIGIQTDIDANNARFEEMKHRRSEAGKKSAAKRATQQSKHCSTEASNVQQSKHCSTEASNVQQSKHCSTVFNNANSVQQDTTLLNNVNSNENEYENEYENVCDEITPHTRTHDTSIIDREISSLKKQTGWLDEEQTLHHVPKDNLIRWLDQFAVQLKADGHPGHADQRDLKSHFNRWLAPKLKEQQKTPSQHDRRSRTNIAPGEVKDYSSSF